MHTPLPFTSRARWVSTIACAILLLSGAPFPASAQRVSYTDVPAGAYYEDAAAALRNLGALDASETRLRPSDLATRAELVKLLVNLNNKQLLYPARSSFDDVPLTAWYSSYFETAANVGWIKGDGNCYQQFRPCAARPSSPVNRAEAAVLLGRAFSLEHTATAPKFPDNAQNQWYYLPIQTARDHCVLQGDAETGLVRPSAYMNRAEMVVMFNRAYENQLYGKDCGVLTPRMSAANALSSTRVRMTFSEALRSAQAEDASRYTVSNVSGESTSIYSATLIDDHTVELALSANLSTNTNYVVTARNLLSQAGVLFTDSAHFVFVGTEGHITNAVAITSTRMRITFDTDLNRARAEEESRYILTNVTNGETSGVQSATLLDSRTVQLDLSVALLSTLSYRMDTQNLLTLSGVAFSDSVRFVLPEWTGNITETAVLSSTQLRVTFDTDLNSARAAQTSRYSVSDSNRTLSLSTAQLLSNQRTVELTLADAMLSQRAYTVNVQNMLTAQGVTFSDSGTLVFDAGSLALRASLNGTQETPSVATSATGTGTFILTANGLQYDISVKSLDSAITAAHFHSGTTGVAGPALTAITFVGNRATGTWVTLTDDQRNSLIYGGIYVNVHTVNHPDGEIRGQLLPQ